MTKDSDVLKQNVPRIRNQATPEMCIKESLVQRSLVQIQFFCGNVLYLDVLLMTNAIFKSQCLKLQSNANNNRASVDYNCFQGQVDQSSVSIKQT